MTELTIRAARPKDAAAIARLSRELNEVVNDSTEHCTPENIKATLFSHDASFHVLVAEKDGAAIGYAVWHAYYDSGHGGAGAWLAEVCVGQDGRGEGAGRALFEAVVEDVRDSPATFMMWTSSETDAAEGLYESSGGTAKLVRRWELNGL
ncbi:GNAT family N-acetyltransferase [Hyphobacterium sp. CCMP332]|jgi:predicted N-acetyltransferase YhbS|uniref:GNAT family N-acetyltransferase n=1 Tax=Hyphobacterium sp. CCMP332 TaxID=2749086 RepID=UPI001650C71B|nr:GNAT family N-acetyltransferase [Hyphobacterium sp. CCMP332]QNL18216.1 GNAT family N-acetyltransferase [Hyphobacterium sp. CCMP332]